MKQKIYFLLLLTTGLLLIRANAFPEGSKELYIGTHKTWLFMCTNNITHCNNGGDRTPFGTYGCSEPDRLYFTTLTNEETVFMGFNGSNEDFGPHHIVFQIRDMSGTIVFPEMSLPTAGTGFIPSISEARVGPTQIYGAGGYTAIDFHPVTPGTFYIEFAMRDNTSGAFFAGGIDIDLFDITIQDTVASVVKPGRLNSKSWQFYETGNDNCSATTFIYSVDSIITSCAFNNMDGGIWVQFCNQWGCANTGNFTQDRKSRNNSVLLPQFKIFLNNPDIILYPPATTLGQIVPPQPYGVQDCNTGHIDYYVNVDKPGAVEIDLTFGGPYVIRILNQQVVVGSNLITWDGLDGTLPAGIPVPNGVTVTFTVKYINGLTNLPFYDIEGNQNGFVVALVNPPGTTPLLYWDDSNLGGTWGTNFTGCLSPPGCHIWTGQAGNNKTVNTWWYNVSATTTPVNITEHRKAGNLTFVQGPQTLCAGTNSLLLSVNPEPNTEVYHWSYTGTGATITQINPTDNFITVSFALNATSGNIQVYGTNANCTAPGPTTSLPITINPIPVVNPPAPNTICANVATNINLTSVPASTNFSWISPVPTCSPNIVSCPPGQVNSNLISDILNLTDNNPGTVVYHIVSTLNGCTSTPQDFTLNVLPSPQPVITGNNNVCLGATGVVYSTTAGMTGYTWSVSAGGTITSGMGTNSITVNWNAVGTQTVSAGYTNASNCTTLIPTVYNITVNPLPVPAVSGPASACAGSTGNIYSTLAGMTGYTWSLSGGGTITAGAGTNVITVTWLTPGAKTVSLNYTDANGCTANTATVYPITVNALPIPVIAGPAAICLNTTGTYSTAVGMTGYLWTVTAGGTIVSGAGTNSININWTANGVHTITLNYTDANGCTAATPSSYTVTVNSLPVPSLTGLNSICSGNSTTYSTDPGMNNYSWLVSAGGTIIAGGTLNDNTVTVTWNIVGAQTVSVNYINGTVCTAPSPTVLNVTVKPRPSVTNAANSTICSNTLITIVLAGSLPATTFTWTATGSSGFVGGYSSSGGPVISQLLFNTGFNVETVDYAVTPTLNGCDGPVAHFIVTVNPVADAYFNPNGQTFCSGSTTGITILSHVTVIGTTFTWTAAGSSGNISGFAAGAGSSINQTLTNIGTGPEFVTYTVTPSFNGCPGAPNTVVVNVNPLPGVTYTACTDVITTSAAQPIKLRGGLPLGGTYSGAGVNTGIFYPSIAGVGNHTINYSYSNTWGCAANAAQFISVVSPPVFLCDNTMTDVRDNKQYPTVKLGTQCWMAANLNYGNVISSVQMQRDNCVFEKYCFSDNPANCTTYGGMYMWDEMMQYDMAAAAQGFCPPGWHVPVENEWTALFNFYISNGFAGAPLKYTGYSGFNAFLSGTRFINVNWNFSNFAVMIWSSTTHGPDKAWAHGMNTYNPSVSYYPSSRTNAFSLRCIKD